MPSSRLIPGQAGGLALVRRRGTNYMAKIGRRGGITVVEKYGTDYMSLLGELASPTITQRRRRAVQRTINSVLRIANA